MELTQTAKQSLDFSTACYLQGMCNAKEYLKAVKNIYIEDTEKQAKELQEKGFTYHGAIKHIYNVDTGETIL